MHYDSPTSIIAIPRMMFLKYLAVVFALLPIIAALDSQALSDRGGPPPVLRINDPFTAPIWRIDVDENEHNAVTGSADKAVTLWNLDANRDPVIHRVPLRDEEQQRAHASAISPDGAIIAYSVTPLRDGEGYPIPNTSRIYIIDADNGILLQTIDQIPNRPQDLRFSPDGRYLAAAISDGCGIRIWEKTDTWKLFAADDQNHGGLSEDDGSICMDTQPMDRDALPDTLSLLFPDQGDTWLVTSGATGVRTYRKTDKGIDLVLHKRPLEIGVDRPDGIALSPDGQRIAVGSRHSLRDDGLVKLQIMILNLEDLVPIGKALTIPESALRIISEFDPLQVPGAAQYQLNRVAWGLIDGKEWVFGVGTLGCRAFAKDLHPKDGWRYGKQEVCAVAWLLGNEDSGGISKDDFRFISVGTDQVMDAVFLKKKQRFLYTTQKQLSTTGLEKKPPEITDGQELLFRNLAADFRLRQDEKKRKGRKSKFLLKDFMISDNAKQVYLEDYRSTDHIPIRLLFDLDDLEVEVLDKAPEGLKNPNYRNIQPIQEWSNTNNPPIIYKQRPPVTANKLDRYRSAVLDSGRRRAVIGSANFIRLLSYAEEKPRVLCERRITAEAFRVNITPDGQLLVVGHGDGVLRWYRIREQNNPKDFSCILDHLLSVRLSEVEWGTNEWTWIAWKPMTGEYAMKDTAEALLEWQLTDKSCQTTRVKSSHLVDKLYDEEAINKALDATLVAPDQNKHLRSATNRFCDPIEFKVVSPERKYGVDTDIVHFQLQFTGSGTWPRHLITTIANGIRATKYFEGKTYGPDDPIIVHGPGDLEIDLLLPPDARVRNGNFSVQFELDYSTHVHILDWTGELVLPEKRRLWAVLVGLSEYERISDLSFAQNDAVDLARLFVNDYQRRAIEHISTVPSDYDELHIDLFVSATEYSKASEHIEELERLDFVDVHIQPTAATVLDALDRIVAENRNTLLTQDLFLFHFSGHGLSNPAGQSKGYSLFLMPQSSTATEDEALTSGALLDRLQQITADKVIIIDACRDVADQQKEAEPFNPAKMNAEYYQRVHNTYSFLSSLPGQASIDQGIFAFDHGGLKSEQGNGLFTYTFLKALTDKNADTALTSPGKIEISEIEQYIRAFFKTKKEEYQSKTGRSLMQMPAFLFSGEFKGLILRSLNNNVQNPKTP